MTKRPLPADLRRMVALIDSAAVIVSACYDSVYPGDEFLADVPPDAHQKLLAAREALLAARPGLLALGGVLTELRLKVVGNYREPGLRTEKGEDVSKYTDDTIGWAWVVVNKDSGKVTLGSECTPQLYCHKHRADEMAALLKPHIGPCRVVRARYRITLER